MKRFTRNVFLATGLSAMCVASAASAQDFQVKGTSSQIIQGQNTDTSTSDKIAVQGLSTPQPNWGIGGQFQGSYMGVQGYAYTAGVGSRYAGYFYASGGDYNYGIYSSGYGTNSYAGYFAGNVYVSGTFTNPSDVKLKKDIADLGGALPQVLSLRPKTYRYRTSDFPGLNLAEGKQVGLLAQDVAAVFPDMVHEVAIPTAEKGKVPEKVLSVDYMKLVPVLIKAVQEQQTEIEKLKAQVQQLKKN